jgi:hypothetical protein
MSVVVTQPFLLFYDRAGEPLENGYIYIGAPGTNPETNPITVYWDASLTTTAAQPIRTLAGYPSRNGSPSNIIASQSPYSILIKDKTGALVFSDLNFSEIESDTPETIQSITDLRLLTSSTVKDQVILIKNYVAGDGGGTFRYDASDTTTADNGGTVIVDAAGRRWKRQYQGPFEVAWFGNDASAWTAAIAAADAAGLGVSVVQSANGNNVIATSPTYLPNTGVVSWLPRFSGAGTKAWAGDQSLYGNATKPSNAWFSLEGRVDRGSGSEDDTQVGLFTSLWIEQTSSDVSYIKMGHYVRAYSEDPSSGGIDRDAVAGGFYGRALSTNGGVKRVWAGYFDVQVDAGGDALSTGIEVDCFNYSTAQDAVDQSNSKYGMRLFASKGPTTAALYVGFSPFGVDPNLNRFHHGLYINPTAIETDGYAFKLGTLGAWFPSGALTVGSDSLRASYTATFTSSGTTKVGIIASGSSNDGVITWVWPLNTAWAMGLDNSSSQLQIASGESLTAPLFSFTSAGALGVGNAVPSLGDATYGIFIRNGAAPTVAPANGFFIYVDSADSNKLKAMNASGVPTTLAL